MRTWASQHARCLGGTLGRFARQPLGSLFNILVIGVALCLPVALYVVIVNLQSVSGQLAPEPQISAFMALDASRAEIGQIENRLKQSARVQRYRYVPRDQALQEFKQSSGLSDVIESLGQNPLPDAFIVSAEDNSPAALEALRDEIAQWPRVVHAQLDAAWARRLDATLRFGRLLVLAVGGLLALALVAVTFNTIRLQVLTRRDEVEVVKLIGATDAFIRRPFLYYGALQGAAGGIVAWLLVTGSVWLINQSLGELSHVYASLFHLKPLPALDTAALIALPAALGWFGAWLSVSRHLQRIEPA